MGKKGSKKKRKDEPQMFTIDKKTKKRKYARTVDDGDISSIPGGRGENELSRFIDTATSGRQDIPKPKDLFPNPFAPFYELIEFSEDMLKASTEILSGGAEVIEEIVGEIPLLIDITEDTIKLIPKLLNLIVKMLERTTESLDFVFDKKNRKKVMYVAAVLILIWALKNNSAVELLGRL